MLEKMKSPAFWLGIFGVLKLVLQAFNVNLINDQDFDAIANGIAALCTVVGVYASHKPNVPPEVTAENEVTVTTGQP